MNKRGDFLFFLAIILLAVTVMGFSALFVPKLNQAEKADVGRSSVNIIDVQGDYKLYELGEFIKYGKIIDEILKNEKITLEEFMKSLEEQAAGYEIKIENKEKLEIKMASKEEKTFSKEKTTLKRKILLSFEKRRLSDVSDLGIK